MGDDDAEDGMRAAALLIHVCGCDCARLVPLRHQHLDVLKSQRENERKRKRERETSYAQECSGKSLYKKVNCTVFCFFFKKKKAVQFKQLFRDLMGGT